MEKTPTKIKRPLWVASLNIALVLTVGSTQAFASGPIEITDQVDLLAIGMNDSSPLSGDYVVTESFVVEAAIGSTYVAGTFTGTFDGGGFTISGLTKPLFGVIAGDEYSPAATISNLTLEAAGGGVSGATIGILAVETYAGTDIENVHVVGNVNGESNVGGLIGINFGGTITNSSATGNVVGTNGVGGLAGYTSGTITNSYAIGIVSGTDDVGGLIGYSQGTITNSYAEVTVTGTGGIGRIGGLAGYSSGTITNSYATGDVEGTNYVGGLVGLGLAAITNSYAAGNVTGDRVVGGLVATALGNISNSYASGNVEADDISDSSEYFGGLAAEAYYPITNSYASGNVTAVGFHIDGLVGFEWGDIVFDSYTSGNVNDTPCVEPCSPLTATELLAILNTGAASPVFALGPSINAGRPYLLSNPPPSEEEIFEEDDLRIDFSFLTTQTLESLNKSFGFELEKSDLSRLNLALLDKVKDDKAAQIIGAKLTSYQSLVTSLSIGSLLQLEINYEANKSLQIWVKGKDDQYVLIGDVTFDKDGNAVLPGIEFKEIGQYEFIFVNSVKKGLALPELINKVSGLTVYVN